MSVGSKFHRRYMSANLTSIPMTAITSVPISIPRSIPSFPVGGLNINPVGVPMTGVTAPKANAPTRTTAKTIDIFGYELSPTQAILGGVVTAGILYGGYKLIKKKRRRK